VAGDRTTRPVTAPCNCSGWSEEGQTEAAWAEQLDPMHSGQAAFSLITASNLVYARCGADLYLIQLQMT
jgi:hypothetical protein